MKLKNYIKEPLTLIASVIICNLAGIIGGFFTETGPGSWYAEELVKPWFIPPSIAFPIVWITLYTLMGISLYLLLAEGFNRQKVRAAVSVFAIQLILNVLWSVLFFGMKSPLFGMIGIIFLWIFILQTIIVSYDINKKAAYLLMPYIAWVSFAAYINAAILMINPVIV
ncbi:tryptophan-rich sensory protein [Methanoplanus sp. FWC-SCC4]|uniref:Tryptophan-rich sensory protein n=1 Tax=Methanochimaera problematica TaxID=2609417 RepID=A0AA97FCV3_9EURY|nr:TspO/MBR family protein [Methanoplanus sp. FWC-SCC4]WOF16717.1 tryptophan-rich sensory protein [Methanoplanus sp. FWC-SCC4]